jgi:lipopolysaccharide export system permease protein
MFFYVLTTYGKKFAREGVLDPGLGAWLSVLVIAPIALLLTYQAAMDSSLLDRTAWGRKINELLAWKQLSWLKVVLRLISRLVGLG